MVAIPGQTTIIPTSECFGHFGVNSRTEPPFGGDQPDLPLVNFRG